MRSILALTLVVSVVGLAPGAEPLTFKITVIGTETRMSNVPAHALVNLPAEYAKESHNAWLTAADASFKPRQCQVTPRSMIRPGDDATHEVHFIIPLLKAGQKQAFTITIDPSGKAPTAEKLPMFAAEPDDEDCVVVRHGDRLVARYMCREFDDSTAEKRFMTYKPFHHLYDPVTGEQRLSRGPEDGSSNFPHHRGLFFGFNRISYGGKNADIWHAKGDAHQRHEEVLAHDSGRVLDRMTARITWRGAGKETFAEEKREVTFYAIENGTLVEFAAKLTPTVDDPVKLDGDPQHAGVQFRAADEVAAKTSKQTYYLRTDGKGKPGETRNWTPNNDGKSVNLPWNAMSFVIGDQRYTAVYLDHPANPKPARYSERPYGRFGSYFEYTMTKDKPLQVRYRLWLQRGEMSVEECEALSEAFSQPPEVQVSTFGG